MVPRAGDQSWASYIKQHPGCLITLALVQRGNFLQSTSRAWRGLGATSDRSPFLTWILAMLSSHVFLSSGVLAYDLARLYCRSTSISGSFSCSFICAVAMRTVRMRLVRSLTSEEKVVCWNRERVRVRAHSYLLSPGAEAGGLGGA